MALFENQQENNLKSCCLMVEEVLTQRGHDAEAARLSLDGGPAWMITAGSARVYVYLTAGEDGEVQNFIQVISPVIRPGPDLVSLYSHLLELNATELTGAAFGLRDRDVVLTTDRTTSGLDRVEVDEMIRRISHYADFYDDLLTVEYGGTRCCDL